MYTFKSYYTFYFKVVLTLHRKANSVKTENHRITAIVEKPFYSFYVNAGIYVLNPSCLDLIPKNQFYDMPSLFEKLLENQQITVSFPIWEYWLDIGRISDFDKANQDFSQVFL